MQHPINCKQTKKQKTMEFRLALTQEQYDLLKIKMPLNIYKKSELGGYVETDIIITDSTHLLTFFHTGIIIGLRNAKHNTK